MGLTLLGGSSPLARIGDTPAMLAHWDEVEAVRRDKGPMGATWQRLGITISVRLPLGKAMAPGTAMNRPLPRKPPLTHCVHWRRCWSSVA